MSLILVTAPTDEPISPVEAKLHLRVDGTDEDSLIMALVQASREYAENYTQRALVTQTWRYTRDGFPQQDPRYRCSGPLPLLLPKPPFQSLVSVKYLDQAGVLQTLALNTGYLLDPGGDSLPARITPPAGGTWPITQNAPASVQVEFNCGYGAVDKIPQSIVIAMKLMVGHWYENREAVLLDSRAADVVVPMAVQALLDPYRNLLS